MEALNNINSKLIALIPKEIAYKYCIIPIDVEEDKIHVAMNNTRDTLVLSYIKFLYKKDVQVHETNKEEILKALSMYYGKDEEDRSIEKLLEKNNEVTNINNIQEIESPASRLTEDIINEAIKKNSSDIHIEPQESEVIVRYRKDGILFEAMKLPKGTLPSIVIRIKLLANMNIAEKRIPQDGKISYKMNSEGFDLRVSSLPTIYGEKIVIRILYKNKSFKNINSLGFTEAEVKILGNMTKVSHGIILVTGPTGSGKSTTLYSILNEVNKRDINITTIEDPVEYSIGGINQINVNNKAGITFASGLRSILRQDPDVIMIGEIRDEETAQIAVRAAITGHKVFSTLHTNDSLGAIYRLTEMGVKKYILIDALIGVISQRLCRKLCDNCKEIYHMDHKERKLLNIDDDILVYKPKGCECCNYTGYCGRVLVSEILTLDKEKKDILVNSDNINSLEMRKKCRNSHTLKDRYIELFKEGKISFDEVLPVISQELMCR